MAATRNGPLQAYGQSPCAVSSPHLAALFLPRAIRDTAIPNEGERLQYQVATLTPLGYDRIDSLMQAASTVKTSESHPLRIATVVPGDDLGRIGITFCPGKKDPRAQTGSWDRNLDLDLDEVQRWGATAVISLITDQEFDRLQVRGLPEAVQDRHMEWLHLPIPDGQPPGTRFERAWKASGEAIRNRLRMGFDVLIHCKGGLGRAGTVAARLLVELGENTDEAIRKVRDARPGAIETREQERHVERCRPPVPIVPS